MRWAMGEQSPRRLRGKSMEDVIFAGSEGRAAVNVAEVGHHLRQQRRHGAAGLRGVERDPGRAPALPLRRVRILPEQDAVPAARHPGSLPRHRHGRQGLHDRGAGAHRRDRVGQARGAPRADRGGGGDRQVQGAAPRGGVEDRARPSRTCCASRTCSPRSGARSTRSSARPRRPPATSGCARRWRVLELSLAADDRRDLRRARPRMRASASSACGRA